MKSTENRFVIRSGICPETVGPLLHIHAGDHCMLVFDDDTCVGVVWEHDDSKNSDAVGQAEIRFFDRCRREYGVWHRMFLNEQRLTYKRLEELQKGEGYIYFGKINRK